jgi:hypothetical protein
LARVSQVKGGSERQPRGSARERNTSQGWVVSIVNWSRWERAGVRQAAAGEYDRKDKENKGLTGAAGDRKVTENNAKQCKEDF